MKIGEEDCRSTGYWLSHSQAVSAGAKRLTRPCSAVMCWAQIQALTVSQVALIVNLAMFPKAEEDNRLLPQQHTYSISRPAFGRLQHVTAQSCMYIGTTGMQRRQQEYLEQVGVEHGPHHQLLHQALGLVLTCNVVPLHTPTSLHNLIAHQLQYGRLQLLQRFWQLPIRPCRQCPFYSSSCSTESAALLRSAKPCATLQPSLRAILLHHTCRPAVTVAADSEPHAAAHPEMHLRG